MDPGVSTRPPVGNVGRPQVQLFVEAKAVASAYLRVAHIYMLISMPTDTSTIFGAFQAIELSLIETGTFSALTDKVMQAKKFAS
jgi:hypothetical protein